MKTIGTATDKEGFKYTIFEHRGELRIVAAGTSQSHIISTYTDPDEYFEYLRTLGYRVEVNT